MARTEGMTVIHKPVFGAILCLALSTAVLAPALAQTPIAPVADDDRLDAAWEDLLEAEGTILNQQQFAALNNLAFQAAVVRVCDGNALNNDAFGKGIAELITGTDKDLTDEQHEQRKTAILVAFGARYGLFLAEGNSAKPTFCDAATKLKASPGGVPVFLK